MAFAIIENGVVSNIVEATPEFAAQKGWKLLKGGAGIGWTFHPGINAFSPPDPIAPNPMDFPLRPDQFYAMMDIAGITENVEAAIEAIPDETERKVARAKLKYTPVFYRDHPLFALLGPSIGLSDEQIDEMWMRATAI